VTGGEDGKINAWPILPIELDSSDEGGDDDDDDDADGMDVDVASPKTRKRELRTDTEPVRSYENNVYHN
jgi:WD repeat-containing protein 89